MNVRRVLLVEHERRTAGRLGRHDEHDPRSRDFPVEAPRGKAKLRPVLWPRLGRIFDQGQLGSCTGNAMAGALNCAPLHRPHVRYMTEKDAVRIYSKATVLDGFDGTYPPEDTGSSGLAVAKVAKREGRIGGYRHAFSLDAALQALQHGPVITGVTWYEGFDFPDEHGQIAKGGANVGGHEFVIRGYDPATGLLTADNSWGDGWGHHGSFFLTAALWGDLLADDGDATVPLPRI